MNRENWEIEFDKEFTFKEGNITWLAEGSDKAIQHHKEFIKDLLTQFAEKLKEKLLLKTIVHDNAIVLQLKDLKDGIDTTLSEFMGEK